MTAFLRLAALCWVASHTAATSFTHTRVSGRNPTTWGQAAIPLPGVYVISVSVDSCCDDRQSSVTVRTNGRVLFSAISRGGGSSAAMAVALNHGDNITTETSEGASDRPGNRLTVTYVDSTDAQHVALKATEPEINRSSGEVIAVDMLWHNNGWTTTLRDSNFYLVCRSGLYWVMARSNPARPHNDVDVRYTIGDGDITISSLTDRLFVLRNSVVTATSCAAAFWLTERSRVFMTAVDGPVWLDPFSLLSLVELRAQGPWWSGAAFTARPDLTSPQTCRRTAFPRSWQLDPDATLHLRPTPTPTPTEEQPPPPGHRAHHRKSLEDPDSVEDAFLLRWLGPILTDHGRMARNAGNDVTIQATGSYLLCMRPDGAGGDEAMSFALHRGRGDVLWVVRARNTPTGEVIAWSFDQGTKLRFYLHSSSTCEIGKGSLISIALSNIG